MLTNVEVAEKMAELEVNVLNKVKLVPFGQIEWKLGYISKVTVDLRTNTIMYLIVLEDGKKVYKTPNAKFFEILDEKVEIVQKARNSQNVELLALKDENLALLDKIKGLEDEIQILAKKMKEYAKMVEKAKN